MFGDIGIGELLLIFGVALLLFGAKRLPELGASLGKGIQAFRRGAAGAAVEEADQDEWAHAPTPPSETAAHPGAQSDGPKRLIA